MATRLGLKIISDIARKLRPDNSPQVRNVCHGIKDMVGLAGKPEVPMLRKLSWKANSRKLVNSQRDSNWPKNNWVASNGHDLLFSAPQGENVQRVLPASKALPPPQLEPTDNASMNLLVNDPNSSMWQLHRDTFPQSSKHDALKSQNEVGNADPDKAEEKSVRKNIQDYYKARWEQENGSLNERTREKSILNDHIQKIVPTTPSQPQPSEVQKPIAAASSDLTKLTKAVNLKQRILKLYSFDKDGSRASKKSEVSKGTAAANSKESFRAPQTLSWKQSSGPSTSNISATSISSSGPIEGTFNENYQKGWTLYKTQPQAKPQEVAEKSSGLRNQTSQTLLSMPVEKDLRTKEPLDETVNQSTRVKVQKQSVLNKASESIKDDDAIGGTSEKSYASIKTPILNFRMEPGFPFTKRVNEIAKRLSLFRANTYSTCCHEQSPLMVQEVIKASGGENPKAVTHFLNKLGGFEWSHMFRLPVSSAFNMQHTRAIGTCTSSFKDPCLPPPLPPKQLPCVKCTKATDKCQPPEMQIKWGACDKICMPCCRPIAKPKCHLESGIQRPCQRPEYRIPSFSECRKLPIEKPKKKECCYETIVCPPDRIGLEARSPFTSVQTRTNRILGRPTPKASCQRKNFSTSSVFMGDKGGDDCKKMAQDLPCVKPSELLGSKGKEKAKSNKDCEKFCMPCCPPARDPPECYYPYVKPPCKKIKPPRPAYSECKTDPIEPLKPCECEVQRAPPCEVGKNAGNKKK